MFPEQVLIVEDELITARYLKNVITKMGLDVPGIYDRGEILLEAVERERPDLILMDINIQGQMDGLELASIIIERYNVPVIFITAYCDSETLSRAMRLSPYGYIVKPFTEVDIQIAIKLAQQRYLENRPDGAEIGLTKVQLALHCWYDLERSVLLSYEKELRLNAKQTQLLELLIKYKNLSVSQEVIEQTLWRENPTSDSTVRTLIYSIRKLAPSIIIETQSKVGYILRTIN